MLINLTGTDVSTLIGMLEGSGHAELETLLKKLVDADATPATYAGIVDKMNTLSADICQLARQAWEFEPSAKPIVDCIRMLLAEIENPTGVINTQASWDSFVMALEGNWVLHHTGGGCMVATLEVKLKDGKIVSLGVTGECAVLYTFSWLTASEAEREREEAFRAEGYFSWYTEQPTDLLRSQLVSLLYEIDEEVDNLIADIRAISQSGRV